MWVLWKFVFWWLECFKDERLVYKDVSDGGIVRLKIEEVGGDGSGGDLGEESSGSGSDDDDGLLFFEVNLNW